MAYVPVATGHWPLAQSWALRGRWTVDSEAVEGGQPGPSPPSFRRGVRLAVFGVFRYSRAMKDEKRYTVEDLEQRGLCLASALQARNKRNPSNTRALRTRRLCVQEVHTNERQATPGATARVVLNLK